MASASFTEVIQKLGEQFPPRLRYDGGDFAAWQQRLRDKLAELAGDQFPLRFIEAGARREPPAVEVTQRVECDGYVRERVTIASVLGTRIPAYILTPEGAADGPRPGVVVMHGHSKHGKEMPAGLVEQEPGAPPADHARAAARAGLVALCPDWWGWNERAETDLHDDTRDMCNVKFMAALMYGLPLLTVMVHDALACVDVLASRPGVDGGRLAVMGNSFGGRMAMWTAAFDGRVSACVSSGALNCFRERSLALSSCGAQYFPGLLAWGDVEDVYASLAPRPLLIMAGSADALLPGEYVGRMVPVIERGYAAAGGEHNLTIHQHGGGHYLPQDVAVPWLTRLFAVV